MELLVVNAGASVVHRYFCARKLTKNLSLYLLVQGFLQVLLNPFSLGVQAYLFTIVFQAGHNLQGAVASGKDLQVFDVAFWHIAFKVSAGTSVNQADWFSLRKAEGSQQNGKQS